MAWFGAKVVAQTEDITVKITEPEKDGIEVRGTYMVKGTASIPAGDHLWVLARRDDFEPFWWPQNEGKIDPTNGEWKVSVTFGQEGDIGWDFDIAAVVVSEEGQAVLSAYREKAMETGEWRPIKMPAVVGAPLLRKVRKVGH